METKSLENLENVKDLLLILVAGLVWKWCAIIAQMRKISAVGIRKLVTEVQIIQIFCEIHSQLNMKDSQTRDENESMLSAIEKEVTSSIG